jgi:hypothetical protein
VFHSHIPQTDNVSMQATNSIWRWNRVYLKPSLQYYSSPGEVFSKPCILRYQMRHPAKFDRAIYNSARIAIVEVEMYVQTMVTPSPDPGT